jgi:hypothetical protein
VARGTSSRHALNLWQKSNFYDFDFFLGGTLAPFLRASDNPIAIACLRLFTVPPFPPLLRFSVPRFRRLIALATVFCAPLLYLRPPDLLLDFFFAGIHPSDSKFPVLRGAAYRFGLRADTLKNNGDTRRRS